MKTSDAIKIGAGIFGVINLVYVGYSLVKNYKDYKNQEGIYAPEEEPVTAQIDLFDGMEAGLEEVEPEIVVEKKPKRKIKKSVWIGVGLFSAVVIGGYCYGFKSGYRNHKKYADELIKTYDEVAEGKDALVSKLEERLENAEVATERITSNALDMLLPDHMETRWVTFDNEHMRAHSHYTPKVTDDLSAEDIDTAVKSMWEKLYEPVVVVPAVEEA
jgi:hypothetical protein